MTDEELLNQYLTIKEKQSFLFLPGHDDSYRRNRYELWDEYQQWLNLLESEIQSRGLDADLSSI